MIYLKDPKDRLENISYSELVSIDTVNNIHEAMDLMNIWLPIRSKKADLVYTYVDFIKTHPRDILSVLDSENLMYLRKLSNEGKYGSLAIPYNEFLPIQKMHLVFTYLDRKHGVSVIRMHPEIYDIYAPALEDIYRKPTGVMKQEMEDFIKDMAKSPEIEKAFTLQMVNILSSIKSLLDLEQKDAAPEECFESISGLFSAYNDFQNFIMDNPEVMESHREDIDNIRNAIEPNLNDILGKMGIK